MRVSNELHAPNRPEEQLFTLVMTSTGPRPRAVAQVLRRELPEEEVDRILVGVPTVVLRGAPLGTARRIRRRLLFRGAEVEARLDGTSEKPEASAEELFTALDASRTRSRLPVLAILAGLTVGGIASWIAWKLLVGSYCGAARGFDASITCAFWSLVIFALGLTAGVVPAIILGGILTRKLIERSAASGGKTFSAGWRWLAFTPSLGELIIFVVRDRFARGVAIAVVAAVAVVAALLGVRAFLQRGSTQVHVLLQSTGGATFSSDGDSCSGTGSYSGFREGEHVLVSDLAGHRLATINLGRGSVDGEDCAFSAMVKLPHQDVYRFEFAGERFLVVPGEFKEVWFRIPYDRSNPCTGTPTYDSLGSRCAEVG